MSIPEPGPPRKVTPGNGPWCTSTPGTAVRRQDHAGQACSSRLALARAGEGVQGGAAASAEIDKALRKQMEARDSRDGTTTTQVEEARFGGTKKGGGAFQEDASFRRNEKRKEEARFKEEARRFGGTKKRKEARGGGRGGRGEGSGEPPRKSNTAYAERRVTINE